MAILFPLFGFKPAKLVLRLYFGFRTVETIETICCDLSGHVASVPGESLSKRAVALEPQPTLTIGPDCARLLEGAVLPKQITKKGC